MIGHQITNPFCYPFFRSKNVKMYTINSRKQRQHKILLCQGSKLLLWSFWGGNKGCFVPWDKNRKHRKSIYSTELGLNRIKNSFFGGNFDWIIILNAIIFVYFTVLAYTLNLWWLFHGIRHMKKCLTYFEFVLKP